MLILGSPDKPEKGCDKMKIIKRILQHCGIVKGLEQAEDGV